MNAVHALAARRAALVAAGLGSTLAAHVVAVGDMHLTRVAPVVWTLLVVVAAICGARHTFAPRPAAVTLLLLVAVQVVLHVVLVEAPWALGVAPHHHAPPMVDTRSVVLHLAAAVVLTALLRGGERALAAAIAAAGAVVRRLSPAPRTPGRPVVTAVTGAPGAPRARAPHRPRSSRGPPVGVALPA